MARFKISHEGHQRIHCILAYRVVEAGSHTPHLRCPLRFISPAASAPARKGLSRLGSGKVKGTFIQDR